MTSPSSRGANATYRVPEGDELVAFVAALPVDAFVAAAGWVEGVEIVIPRGGAEETRAVPGRVALLSLVGAKGGPLMATLARGDGEGVIGGQLVKARSAGVALAVLAGGEAPSAHDAPEATAPAARQGAPSSRAPADGTGARDGAAPAAAPNAWTKIAAIRHEDDDETDEAPKYGDRVHHFVFGLCDVMVVRGERMKIRDVHGPGRLREIHLNAVKVLPPTVEDGKRVFKLVKRN